MHRSQRTRLVAVGLSALASACSGEGYPDEGVEDIGSITSALNEDGLTTDYDAQVAVAAATDHLHTIWTVTNATGKQIAGRSFGFTGAPYGDPSTVKLHTYSEGDKPKSAPAVSWDVEFNTALVVWQQDFSGTDSDIWGRIIRDDGSAPTPPFAINQDLADEKKPAVVKVRSSGNRWFVAYTRKDGANTSLSGNWVSDQGVTDPQRIDLVQSGVNASAAAPTMAYIRQFGGNVLFTWNDKNFAFGDPDFGLGVTLTANASAVGITSGYNSINGLAAIAWRQGSGTSTRIVGQTFPGGCALQVCATAPTNFISAGGSVNGLTNPVITEDSTGFVVFSGARPTSLKRIAAARIKSNGALGTVTNSIIPNCSGNLQSSQSLGSPYMMAAATPADDLEHDARAFMLYNPFCATSPLNARKRFVSVGPDVTQSAPSYPVANP